MSNQESAVVYLANGIDGVQSVSHVIIHEGPGAVAAAENEALQHMVMLNNSKGKLHSWDPNKVISKEPPVLNSALVRIKKDLMSLYVDPPPGIFVTACENDIRNIHALVVGPMDTPYEGGMFYFYMRCPYDFPIKPPRVKLMTTDAGRVRFNPNMYACGKVCLSIIGTWTGPAWTPAQQISTLLISIQSLLNENPITNEPGFEKLFKSEEAELYKTMITYETIRAAVIGMVENECHLNLPSEFVPIIENLFLQYFDIYVETCTRNLSQDGKRYKDPLHTTVTVQYDFKGLLERLHTIKEKLMKKRKLERQPSSDGDGSDYKDDEEAEDNAGGNAYVASSSDDETEKKAKSKEDKEEKNS